MAQISPLVRTALVTHPIDSHSANLPSDFKAFPWGPIRPDLTPTPPLYAAKVIRDVGNYVRIEFDPHLTIYGERYTKLYAFAPHWKGITATVADQVARSMPLSAAGSSIVSRNCTHYAQINNYDWADDGSVSNLRYGAVQCGGTSAAIVLSEEGVLAPNQIAEIMRLSPTGKFDDGVLAIFKKIGAKSVSMEGHQAVFRYFGIDAIATRTATLAELREHIEKYGAAVLGTIYKADGHFTATTGYDMAKNLQKILCPFGIRNQVSTNQWDAKFSSESDVRPDWWGPQMMKDLWASQDDGWCVLPKPKRSPIVLQAASNVPATSNPVSDGGNLSTVTANVDGVVLKALPIAANAKGQRCVKWPKGNAIKCVIAKAENQHLMITLSGDEKIAGEYVWYVFRGHVDVYTPGGLSTSTPGAKITQADVERAAAAIGVEPRAMAAVLDVEAAGSGFFENGRCKILFEAHWFSYYSGDLYNDSHPEISSRTWNRSLYIGGEPEWGRLEAAAKLNKEAAYRSASYGLGQVMGFNGEKLGYGSVFDFVAKMQESEGEQLMAMARFIAMDSTMLRALKNLDWAGFAYCYNGEGYALNEYDIKLAEAYAALA
jgi:N-acetylmuramidase